MTRLPQYGAPFGGGGRIARITNFNGIITDRGHGRSKRAPHGFSRQRQIQQPLEVMRPGKGDSRFNKPGLSDTSQCTAAGESRRCPASPFFGNASLSVRRNSPPRPYQPIRASRLSCSTIPVDVTSRKKASPARTRRRISAGVRTIRSIGKVRGHARRMRVAVWAAEPRWGMITIRSTSESSVGCPLAYEPNSTTDAGRKRHTTASTKAWISQRETIHVVYPTGRPEPAVRPAGVALAARSGVSGAVHGRAAGATAQGDTPADRREDRSRQTRRLGILGGE
jgi:hypothetical protein